MTGQRILIQLEALRQAMKQADSGHDGSFAKVFSAFLDAAADPGLLDASKPIKDAALRAILEATARRLTGDGATAVERLQLLRVAGADFVHGGFSAGRHLGTFFYFEKDQQGILAFHGGGATTHMTRITVAELPAGTMPAPGPKGLQ